MLLNLHFWWSITLILKNIIQGQNWRGSFSSISINTKPAIRHLEHLDRSLKIGCWGVLAKIGREVGREKISVTSLLIYTHCSGSWSHHFLWIPSLLNGYTNQPTADVFRNWAIWLLKLPDTLDRSHIKFNSIHYNKPSKDRVKYDLRVLRKTTYHGPAVMRYKRTHWIHNQITFS